jgi:uncharacterized protein YecE (DUF72 family)
MSGEPAFAPIRIGTSGWLYKSWRGAFYPPGLKQREEFAHYAKSFDTVELNGSFYRLPIEGAPERWRKQAPPGFLYAWKYPRWLTHYYRLRDPQQSYDRVFARMRGLGAKAGPVLFQLPPHFKVDRERLATALECLPKRVRAAWEFRHPSWYDPAIYDLLAAHDAALCISDHADAPAPWRQTASWIYVRGHGPSGRYHGAYGEAALKRWSKSMISWAKAGSPVFCYFDNDIDAAAPKDAARLKKLISKMAEQARVGAGQRAKGS